MSYRWLDHTAELELEIEAASQEAVFAEAVVALGELLDDGGAGRAISYEVSLAGTDRALLLADWLDELVFRAETESVIPQAADRVELAEAGLHAVVRGRRGPARPLVKGVTHHRLALENADGVYRATVVLDV